MKQTWTETHFGLRPENQPLITTHDGCVSLHLPGYLLDGQGFAIIFTPAHLTVAQRLVAALEALPPLGAGSEADPC